MSYAWSKVIHKIMQYSFAIGLLGFVVVVYNLIYFDFTAVWQGSIILAVGGSLFWYMRSLLLKDKESGENMVVAIRITSDGIMTYAYPDGTKEIEVYECSPMQSFWNIKEDEYAELNVTRSIHDINVYDGGLRIIEKREE